MIFKAIEKVEKLLGLLGRKTFEKSFTHLLALRGDCVMGRSAFGRQADDLLAAVGRGSPGRHISKLIQILDDPGDIGGVQAHHRRQFAIGQRPPARQLQDDPPVACAHHFAIGHFEIRRPGDLGGKQMDAMWQETAQVDGVARLDAGGGNSVSWSAYLVRQL